MLATYKLGAIEVEKGDGAKGKELIEAAQREKPGLVHLDYNLGRAEMLLGDDAVAASHFERSVKTDTDPQVVSKHGTSSELPIGACTAWKKLATPWPSSDAQGSKRPASHKSN